MAKTFTKNLTRDLSQLDDAWFGTAQKQLGSSITTFVNVFEGRGSPHLTISEDMLAGNYVQLTGCHKILKTASEQQEQWVELAKEAHQITECLDALHTKMQAAIDAKKAKPAPFAEERTRFLAELNAERNEREKELLRQQDKMEEHYERMMRESTYRNLVGLRQDL